MPDLKLEPRSGRRRFARDQTGCEVPREDAARGIEDVLVDRRPAAHHVRGDEPLVPAREEVIREFSPVGPPRIAVYSKGDEPAFGVFAEAEVGLTCGLCHRSLASVRGWARVYLPMHLRRGHRKEGRIRLGHGLGRSWGCWRFTNRNYRHGYCPNKVLFEVFCCCGVAAADMNDGALPPLLVEGVPTGCWTGEQPEAPGR